ncbi:cytochrome C oxidase subunit II [Virgibacillus sp. C22-A2]|uniref:Cytochrome aa3 subunit 2 n=1 Tax=Virgibacillus tibetensis TaxID=3042313 RepID=A0ABU6KF09_9BACI|nr:cytochrome C oxidase subunit II [Virgibacillus sp. C22-A2]
MVQTAAWVTSLFFMLIVTAVFAFVAMNSTEKKDYEPIKKKWYKARTFYGSALIIFFLIITIYTLRDLPYNQPAYGEGREPEIVDVEALQFGWNISETQFKTGEPIEFHVTSADVTHGFGIYDKNLNLIAQTQAMPEYTNKVYITFEQPGTYKILCMEYCGLAHHLMVMEIEVTD